MKLTKNLLIILGVVLTMGLISSCDFTTKQKIESGLKEPLSVYPTKNLEDFTIKKDTETVTLVKMIKVYGQFTQRFLN